MSESEDAETKEILSKVDCHTFEEDDWNNIVCECVSLAAKWEILSAYLDLKMTLIDTIKKDHPGDCTNCLTEALKEWIKQNHTTRKCAVKPSWRTLLQAVAKVDQQKFKKLAENHQEISAPVKDDVDESNKGVTIEASETLTSSSVGLGSLAEKVEGEMKYSTTESDNIKRGSRKRTREQAIEVHAEYAKLSPKRKHMEVEVHLQPKPSVKVDQESAEQVLTESDIGPLMALVHKFSDKWHDIGLELGFTPSELNQISSNPSLITSAPASFLKRLLSQWVQWPTVDHPTKPTLGTLCGTLRSSLVGLGTLAKEVEREMKCSTTDVKSTGMASKRKLHEATCSEQVTFKKVEDCELITNKGLLEDQTEPIAHEKPVDIAVIIEDFEDQFRNLRKEIRRQLVASDIDTLTVIDSLTSLPTKLKKEYEKTIIEALPPLSKEETIQKLFFQLNPLFSFIDYGLLQYIIKEYGNDTLNKDMKTYCDDIQLFMKQTTIKELIDCKCLPGQRNTPPDFDVLKAKIGEDAGKCTLEEINTLRKRFCAEVKLSEVVFCLIALEDSNSFIASWLVPSILVPDMIESAREIDESFFDMKSIISLSVGNQWLYNTAAGLTSGDASSVVDSAMGESSVTSTAAEATLLSDDLPDRELRFCEKDINCSEENSICGVELASKAVGLTVWTCDETTSIAESDSAMGKSSASGIAEESHQKDIPLSDKDITQRKHADNIETASIILFGSKLDDIRKIIETMTDVDFKIRKLYLTSLSGELREVKLLIEDENLDPSEVDCHGYTCLHFAAVGGHKTVMRYFIEDRECNEAQPDKNGLTPLHYAAGYGNFELVQYLVGEKQIEPMCMSKSGATPLHCASFSGNTDVIHYLVKEMSTYLPLKDVVHDRDREGLIPLHYAALHDHLDAIKFLITDLNSNPNITDNKGRNVVHVAAQNGHVQVVKYLTEEEHCNSSCLAKGNVTPLHLAAFKGHLDVVKYLTLEQECDPLCTEDDNNTPLQLASIFDYSEVVEFLRAEISRRC